jgi:hypothetical protein
MEGGGDPECYDAELVDEREELERTCACVKLPSVQAIRSRQCKKK